MQSEARAGLLLLFAFSSAALGQNYTGYPQITFSASASTPVTPGTAVTLTGQATCPSGSCTYNLYTAFTGSSPEGASLNTVVQPRKTTTYTYQVVNASVIVAQRDVTVFVGGGNLGATQSTAPANGGPGVPAVVPQYQAIELTFTIPGAGCADYVPAGSATVACSGGTVSNPWFDVQGYCTFTGQTSGYEYTPRLFYEGAGASGNGNVWKVRFSPPTAEVWDSSCIVSDPTDYRIFTNTSLFASVPDLQAAGPLSLYGAGNPRLLKTANGQVFYPLSVDFPANDIGNNGAAPPAYLGDFGYSPLPMTGGQDNRVSPLGLSIAQWSQAGFNLFSIAEDDAGQLVSCGNGAPVFAANGAGLSNGSIKPAGMTLDAAALAVAASRLQIEMTPDAINETCNTNYDSFASPAATRAYMEAWQYYINRWGAYVSIWNLDSEQNINVPFVASMALWIKQQDPYKRVLVTAVNQSAGTIANQNLDLNTPHRYFGGAINPATTLAASVASALSPSPGSPVYIPSVPLILGETGFVTGDSDPPANEFMRIIAWAAFFNSSFVSYFPGAIGNGNTAGGVGYLGYIGQPQELQFANFNSFVQNFDPSAIPINVTVNGGANHQMLNGYALGSANDAAVYIANITNRTTVHNATIAFAVPASDMACSWIRPVDGVVLSAFITGGAGVQTFTMPDWGDGNQYGDLLLRCRNTSRPVVTTVTAPPVVTGMPYNLTLMAAGGAGPPYTWSILAGALPHGLSLDPLAGAITGTPDTPLYWNLLVQAADARGTFTAPQKLIIPVLPPISVPITNLDNYNIGGPFIGYHPQPINVSGGVPPVSCTLSGALPAGVTAGPFCTLTGTANSSGTFSVTATASDALGNNASSTIGFTVSSTPLVIVTSQMPGATAGYYYQAGVQVFAPKPYVMGIVTWSVSSGSLCPGLKLVSFSNTMAGVVGTVSGNTCTFSLTATDSNLGASPPQSLTIVVNPPPSITLTSLPDAHAGMPYYQHIDAAGGTPLIWCIVTAGVLPSGLSLDSGACEIYGTPHETGSFQISISARDIWNAGETRAFALESHLGRFRPFPLRNR